MIYNRSHKPRRPNVACSLPDIRGRWWTPLSTLTSTAAFSCPLPSLHAAQADHAEVSTRTPSGCAEGLSRHAPLHGYAIMIAIKEVCDGVLCVDGGSLYPVLHRMEKTGLIRAKWIAEDSGRRMRIYDLTARGRKQLGREEARWTTVADAVQRVLKFA